MKAAALFVALLLMPLAGFAEEQESLKFGIYTTDKPTEVYNKFEPLTKGIEEGLTQRLHRPVHVELVIGKDYDTTRNQLAKGEIDFSRLGPASYLDMKKENPGLRILAVELEKGRKEFYGAIFVRSDSPIRSIQDLQGKTFAFGDKDSTIGRYLAQRELLVHKIQAKDLKRFDYLDRHDKVCSAVLAGDFDAGAAKYETFKEYKDKAPGLREIQRLVNVTKPWVARAGLDPKTSRALSDLLLQWHDEALLANYGVTGFTTGKDGDYRIIGEAMKSGKVFDPSN